jgi:hypothetical protein
MRTLRLEVLASGNNGNNVESAPSETFDGVLKFGHCLSCHRNVKGVGTTSALLSDTKNTQKLLNRHTGRDCRYPETMDGNVEMPGRASAPSETFDGILKSGHCLSRRKNVRGGDKTSAPLVECLYFSS